MSEPADRTHSWAAHESTPAPRRWTPVLLAQLAVVLIVLATAVLAAGVLRRSSGEDQLSVVRAASTSAAAQDSFRATYELRLTASGLDVSSKGEMLVDVVNKLSSGTIQAPGLGQLRIVATADAAYVQLPAGRVDSAGNHWLSFRSANGTAAVGAQDPLAVLGVVGDPDQVETVGRETLHDVDTTHYRVRLDPKRLADAVAGSGQNITLPTGTLGKVSGSTLDLWVDGRKLPRRLEVSLAVEQVTVSLVFEYLDYGKPVQVVVPAASDVTMLPSPKELFAKIGAALTG